MTNRALVAAMVVLTFAILLSTAARGLQNDAVGWDPVSCWDCTTPADYYAPIVLGYILGGIVGVCGPARRRFAILDANNIHILDLR